MRRRLIVMRHAKSSWDSGVANDHARPLNKRGQGDAPRVAAQIAELGWTPDAVLSSDSARTTETYERMRDAFGDKPSVRFLSHFYEGTVREIREELAGLEDDVGTVLVLGHNPGWQAALAWFTGEQHEMTTANAALLECSADTWAEAVGKAAGWTLVELIRPKELDD